jgi:hypothetical protein
MGVSTVSVARRVVRILCGPGDSITRGSARHGAYRPELKTALEAVGISPHWIGSVQEPADSGQCGCHEGHDSTRISTNTSSWATYAAAFVGFPQLAVVVVGSADIVLGEIVSVPARITALLDAMWTTYPGLPIVLGPPPAIFPGPSYGYAGDVATAIAAYAAEVATRISAGNKISLCDFSALVAEDIDTDGVHPLAAGYAKMSAAIMTALQSMGGVI